MLFKRRDRQPVKARMANLLWPRMGWRRMTQYYKQRIVRSPSSERELAAGLAFGCAVSWTPTFGFHFVQCFALCWVFKANFWAAVIGTVFGNPWTFPVLMFISYHLGRVTLTLLGYGDWLTYHHGDTLDERTLEGGGWRLLAPTLLGGYMMMAATFPLFYYFFYNLLKKAREARKQRIENKMHQDARLITGRNTQE